MKAAIKDKKYKKDIDADMELADDVQASGTPHFFVNGRRLVGAQPFEKFQKIIDEELARSSTTRRARSRPRTTTTSLMKDAKGAPEPEKKVAPPVPAGAPYKGGKDAKVVIQEWSDFQCPFCARVEPTVNEVLKTYGDKVKIVWRDKPLPMHPDAPLAAEAAREALKQKGPDGFWKMHDKMFAEPAEAEARRSRRLRQGDRPRHGQVQGRARQPHAQGGGRRRRQGRHRRSASAARPRS